MGTSLNGSWLSYKFPVQVDGGIPRVWSGPGRGSSSLQGCSRRVKEVSSGSRGPERRKPETRGASSPTTECSPGLAEWAAPGSPSQGLEGFGLGVRSGALLQALAFLAFQLTFPPLKRGIFPERKREPAGPRMVCGSHVSHGKLGHQMRQNSIQGSVLYRTNELGGIF